MRNTSYLRVKEKNETTHLKVDVYYSLGGMNYFTGRTERRGYYISVTPVGRKRSGGCMIESFSAFSGIKMLALEVKRQSAKKEQEAIVFAKTLENDLIQHVLDKNGLELEEE